MFCVNAHLQLSGNQELKNEKEEEGGPESGSFNFKIKKYENGEERDERRESEKERSKKPE